ncbi:LysR family transcriptional regulator [Mesorhizobium sp. CGMCC 1.15528]|uniref:LysR family transcriptional regulator n=1 Tax=Mesorhizobium zhangyense TaxID=1776730 RepID=A0A7C9VFE1_9HYPH|nr:LysR family transcriptional regulator [Mesorhizobium zhangyense]NGN43068.1 LysR family transcriptional regulator [Mesorhizobium zhangyense]
MESLGSLRAFVLTAEARSFTIAGRHLGISPSAAGKAVARLEEHLGVRLFHRSTRSIALTPEGSLFLERCRRIFGEIEAAELELSQTRGAPKGKLRVSLPIVGMLMMPTISAFVRTYTEIELDLDFNDRLVNVVEEGFDAVVRTGDATDSRLMTRVLGASPYLLAGSPGYFDQRGFPANPADLKNHIGLRHRYPSTGLIEPWPLGSKRRKAEVEISTAAVSSGLEPLIFMAEQDLGLIYVPEFAIHRQLADGTLVSVLEDYIDHSVTFRMLWPSTRQLSPKLRVFVDFLADNLFSLPSAVADMEVAHI